MISLRYQDVLAREHGAEAVQFLREHAALVKKDGTFYLPAAPSVMLAAKREGRPIPSIRTMAKQTAAPVPREKWPEGIAELATARAEGDVGVGDTFKREYGTGSVEWFAEKFPKITHKVGTAIVAKLMNESPGDVEKAAKAFGFGACGCKDRQALMNQRYPY